MHKSQSHFGNITALTSPTLKSRSTILSSAAQDSISNAFIFFLTNSGLKWMFSRIFIQHDKSFSFANNGRDIFLFHYKIHVHHRQCDGKQMFDAGISLEVGKTVSVSNSNWMQKLLNLQQCSTNGKIQFNQTWNPHNLYLEPDSRRDLKLEYKTQ